MKIETVFRIITIAIFSAGVSVGFYYRLKAHKAGDHLSRKEEGWPILISLRLFGLVLWLSIIGYMVNPSWMGWAAISLPLWLRWLGAGVGLTMIPLIFWLFRSIGNNITDTVVTRNNHQLITHGPYRWIRHPLYTFGTSLFISLGLMAANWFIIGLSMLGLLLLLIRLPREEAALIEKFGDEYRTYIKQTGSLFPRLFAHR